MAELDHDLLKRLEYLALLAERSGGGPLLDGGRKKLSGDVMEVARRRDYVPGDDYRHIDWAWCARRDELLTRVFERYEDAHFYILLDCSASMGAGRPSKFHLARQAAAALGYLALSRLDRLGVAAFADGLVAELPPLRHKSRFARLLRFLDELALATGPTDFARSAAAFVARPRRRGPVVVLSDLYDPRGFEPGLELLRYHGYEPRLVQFQALQEMEPGLAGDVELFDVETQAVRRVTITEKMNQRFRRLLTELQVSMLSYCRSHSIPFVYIAEPLSMEQILHEVIVAKMLISDIAYVP